MLRALWVAWLFSMALSSLGPGAAWAQKFPTKPIRLVTSGAGGGTDFVARLIAHGVSESLGQRIIVDNRPSGVIPGEIVSQATPDGYTLLLATGILWLLPYLQDNVPYDPVKDFSTVTLAVSSPNILTVTKSLPAKSVKELIALAKAKPAAYNYAVTSIGGGAHLAAELFMSMAGVNMLRVPYKSGGTAITELISGQVHLYFVSAGSVVPHIKAGRLRALAVTSAKPSAQFPALPPIAATLPGYEYVTVYGVFAPARTPAARINLLQKAIARAINTPDIKARFLASAVEPVGSTREALSAFRQSEMLRMGKIIRDTIRNPIRP
ncbi:MAG: tripartite tricarboxylate transporter substrate binding protein [Betaproteobacteria bacterium]|nr:tripartite tricarboxylate transporter substrate binding protein [Betaproteobacteria bacterium]